LRGMNLLAMMKEKKPGTIKTMTVNISTNDGISAKTTHLSSLALEWGVHL
jgi:hypothetical protein